MPDSTSAGLATRLREVREEIYGAGGATALAEELGIAARTWLAYEAVVTIPVMIAFRFALITKVSLKWLLTGDGPRYTPPEDP